MVDKRKALQVQHKFFHQIQQLKREQSPPQELVAQIPHPVRDRDRFLELVADEELIEFIHLVPHGHSSHLRLPLVPRVLGKPAAHDTTNQWEGVDFRDDGLPQRMEPKPDSTEFAVRKLVEREPAHGNVPFAVRAAFVHPESRRLLSITREA